MDSYSTIFHLTDAAEDILALGATEPALERCRRAVAIADEFTNKALRAEAYIAVARVLRDAGKIDGAMELTEQALPVFVTRYGPDSFLTVAAKNLLAQLREAQAAA